MRSRRAAAAIGAWTIVMLTTVSAGAELLLGVHPFKPATKLIEAFTPLAACLGDKLGEHVTLRIAKDYQAHTDAIGRDELDIAYMGPASYVALVERYGPKPLLGRQVITGKSLFHGKIFVRSDSPIRTLADLTGKRFAFGEPHSTMSHLLPRYMLWEAGVGIDRFAGHAFVGDHVNVALGVLAGDYDAGAVKEDVYFRYEGQGLRAIATSPPIADHVFVAGRKLSEEMVRRLRAIMLGLHEDTRCAAALQAMTPGVTALIEARDADYDSLRTVLAKLRELGVPY
ncbi:MAG: phosphate/phosphite/phosphonate ABC transporter substrate-binding protein [Nitrospirota bacterium]